MDSVALALTVGRQGSTTVHKGRHGHGWSVRRNQRGVDVAAVAAAAMSGSRGSTSGPLLSSLVARRSSIDVQGEAPHSLFDALIQLKVFISL